MSAWSPAPASPNSAPTSCVVDTDAGKLAALRAGRMPIYEPGLDKLVAENVAAGRLAFTADLADAVHGAEAVFIAVGTPTRRGDGHADLTYVFAAAEQVARALDRLRRSSSPNPPSRSAPAARSRDIVRAARPDLDFDVASNPEFLREGNAIGDFMRPDRVVIGTESERARASAAPALPAAVPDRGADRVHRHRDGRADQICRQRLPGDEGHLHQRDGRSVREGRRRCARRGARHRPRRPHRPQVPACRARAMAGPASPRTRWR